MKQLKDIMSLDVQVVRPEASLHEVAEIMKNIDSGALPVCDGRKLHGMITDRDLVVRALASRRDPAQTFARDVMTPDVLYGYEDYGVGEAATLMRKNQVRRLIVVDHDKNLVGIVSLGDLAMETSDESLAARTLEDVSQPSGGAPASATTTASASAPISMVSSLAPLALGFLAGAGAMFLFDASHGRRRRSLIRDETLHYGNVVSREATARALDLRNRAQGIAANAKLTENLQ